MLPKKVKKRASLLAIFLLASVLGVFLILNTLNKNILIEDLAEKKINLANLKGKKNIGRRSIELLEYYSKLENLEKLISSRSDLGQDILVEVKPIRCLEEWENHPDYGKVINSGILNTNTLYDFLVLGANSFLIHSTPDTHDKDTVIGYYSDIGEKRYYRESDDDGFIEPLEVRLKKDPPTFIFEDAELTYCSKNERVGFSVIMGNWYDRINKENYHKPYNQFAYRREELEELKFKWNQIQSKYQWQPTR